MTRFPFVVSIVVITLLAAPDGLATCPTDGSGQPICFDQFGGVTFDNPNGEWTVVPEISKVTQYYPDIDGLEFQQAVAQGAAVWNDYTNSRSYKVGSTTTNTSLPPLSDLNCTDTDRKKVKVIVLDTNEDQNLCGTGPTVIGCAMPRCITSSSPVVGRAGLIIILRRHADGAGPVIPWGVGGPFTNGESDLVSVLGHELGHVANLGHSDPEIGIMSSTSVGIGFRDPYAADLDCERECAQKLSFSGAARELSWFTRQVSPTGTFSAEVQGPGLVADISTSFRLSGGSRFVARSEAEVSTACTATGKEWIGNFTSGSGQCIPGTLLTKSDGIGPVSAVFRPEDETIQYVFHAERNDTQIFSPQLSSHRLIYQRSSNEFATVFNGILNQCTSMTGWMTCSSSTPILSNEPPYVTAINSSLGANDPNGVSVVAWVNNTRDGFPQDHRVFVAARRISAGLLPLPDSLPILTSTAPAISCQQNFSSTFDCLVAYVPLSNTTNTVHVRRLSISAGATRYSFTMDPVGSVPVQDQFSAYAAITASRPALLRLGSVFVLVVRSGRSNQPLEAFKSSDGITWDLVSSNLGYSSVPPQVQTSWTGITVTPQIVYAR